MSIGRKTGIKSFTLVELLIVIAILAVLAAAVVVVLNPAELLAQARDSQRVTDMKTMKDAIDLWTVDNPSVTMGTSQTVYISIPDTSSTCANITGLPSLPSGWAYHCVTTSNSRNINGTGWIPLDFTTVKGGSPVPYLPLDPQNDATLTRYYSYIPGGSYELTALFESEKQGKTAQNDGGIDPGRLEIGSDLGLWKSASGIMAYWDFEEGSGTSLIDKSGNGNNGVWNGTSAYATGKVGGYAGSFSSPNYVEVADSPSLNSANRLSFSAWIKMPDTGAAGYVMAKNNVDSSDIQYAIYHYGTEKDINFGINGSASRCSSPDNAVSDNNRWYHVAGSWDGSVIRIYVDGNQVNSCNYTTAITQTAFTINIGRRKPSSLYFPGNVDELIFYNRALSAGEVRAIYNSGK